MTTEWLAALDPQSLKEAADEELYLAFERNDEALISRLLLERIEPGADHITPPPWLDNIKIEVCELICGNDPKYAKERKMLADLRNGILGTGQNLSDKAQITRSVVLIVAGGVASSIGVAWGVVIGAVGMLLYVALKVGVNAMCRGIIKVSPPPQGA